MYPSIIKVTPGEDYVLLIDFDNAEGGTLYMKQFLNFGVFRRLKDHAVIPAQAGIQSSFLTLACGVTT